MWLLYNISVFLGQFVIWLIAPFNKRIRQWKQGRKGLFAQVAVQVDSKAKHTWFHFASLGEFEQGRPVLEAFKEEYPTKKIIITFFSPSGYEIRKNYALADHVFYLPLDTPGNARKWADLIHPEMAFFVKYEFWPNYFKELHRQGTPLYLISAIFRENQFYFKWYGRLFRPTLSYVRFYFAQNQESVALLRKIGLHQVMLTGDTRFDRVVHLSSQERSIDLISRFTAGHRVLVAGSTWLPDEELLASLKQVYPEWKMIIAPHLIDEVHLKEIAQRFGDSVRFSVLNAGQEQVQEEQSVLVIDNIGMLSYLYGYADIAYVGGGFGVGIHNILEAATYGVPVIFGPEYHKFQEAKDLIKAKAAFSVGNLQDLVEVFENLQDETTRKEAGARGGAYVQQQAGATGKILRYIREERDVSTA